MEAVVNISDKSIELHNCKPGTKLHSNPFQQIELNCSTAGPAPNSIIA